MSIMMPSFNKKNKSEEQPVLEAVEDVESENEPEFERHPDETLVTHLSSDGKEAQIVFIDGRKYQLQHPGILKAMEWDDEMLQFEKKKAKMNQAGWFQKVYHSVVFCIENGPMHGSRVPIEQLSPKEAREWKRVLELFMDGSIAG